MTMFSENFQASAAHATYFGEDVYWFRGGSGEGVAVPAVVSRQRLTRDDDDAAERIMEATSVTIAPTLVAGLLSDVDSGLRDEVEIAAWLGASTRRRYVVIDRHDRADGDLQFTLQRVEESQAISHGR